MGILQEMWNHPKTLSGIPHLPLQPLLVILVIYHWMCFLLLYFIAPVNFNVTQLEQIPFLTILMFCQSGHRNTRVVEISDIVNRIAPKVSRWFFSTNIPNYSSVQSICALELAFCSKKNIKMRASAPFSFLMSHTGKTTTRCWISSAAVDRGQCPVHPRHPKAQRQEEVLQVGKCFIQLQRHVLNHAQYKRVLNLNFLVFFFPSVGRAPWRILWNWPGSLIKTCKTGSLQREFPHWGPQTKCSPCSVRPRRIAWRRSCRRCLTAPLRESAVGWVRARQRPPALRKSKTNLLRCFSSRADKPGRPLRSLSQPLDSKQQLSGQTTTLMTTGKTMSCSMILSCWRLPTILPSFRTIPKPPHRQTPRARASKATLASSQRRSCVVISPQPRAPS